MVRKGIIAVLTLATVGSVWVWVDCYGGRHWRQVAVPHTGLRFSSWDGRCTVGRFDMQFSAHGNNKYAGWLGERFFVSWSDHHLSLSFPAWVPCIVFGAYPFFTLLRIPARRRRRRRKQGLCLDCGYNLTGNVTGVCSECGSKVEQA